MTIMQNQYFTKSSENYTIIVVEDDVSLNTLIQKTLQRSNYTTRGFYSGYEAVEWLKKDEQTAT